MRKKEYEFWGKALEYKRINHVLELILEKNEESSFAIEFKTKLDGIEQELFNFVVDNKYPLKKIPYYLDSLREDIISLNRKKDKKEIRRLKK